MAPASLHLHHPGKESAVLLRVFLNVRIPVVPHQPLLVLEVRGEGLEQAIQVVLLRSGVLSVRDGFIEFVGQDKQGLVFAVEQAHAEQVSVIPGEQAHGVRIGCRVMLLS